jgi:hypothetical protein
LLAPKQHRILDRKPRWLETTVTIADQHTCGIRTILDVYFAHEKRAPSVLLVPANAVYPQSNQAEAMMARWKKSQTYASEGFQPFSCFAGQVKVEGKRLRQQPFSLFAPDQNTKCCGALLKSGRTDQHGHFLVEPLHEGRYFVRFESVAGTMWLLVSP